MDPQANLKRQIEIARCLAAGTFYNEYEAVQELAEELADLVLALNNWLYSGGFAPNPIPPRK